MDYMTWFVIVHMGLYITNRHAIPANFCHGTSDSWSLMRLFANRYQALVEFQQSQKHFLPSNTDSLVMSYHCSTQAQLRCLRLAVST